MCLISLVCLSQEERQYAFAHYSTDKGLAGHEVKSIVQDKAGYLWLGTATGLQRFDGTRFITYYHRTNDPTSIPENHINQLFLDKKHNLWLLTVSGQVGIFDTKHFRFKPVAVQPNKKSSLFTDKKFYTDSRGNLYLLCFRSELLVYNEKENRFVPTSQLLPLPPKWPIISFCEEAGTGKYIIGTDSGLVVYNSHTSKLSYKDHNTEQEPLIKELGHVGYVAPLLLDSKHRLWFISWHPNVGTPSMYCYDLYHDTIVLKKYSFLPLVKEYHEPGGMIEQKSGTIWIRGTNLFASFLEKEKKFQLVHNGYVNDQSIAYEMVHDLKEDREKNLWVATSNNGLYQFNPSREYFLNVRHINRTKNKPGEGSVLSFMPDQNGTVLMGAWGNGIYRYDSSFANVPLNIKGINENNSLVVWTMVQGNDGRTVWMGTQPGGLYKYDRITKTATYYEVPALEKSTVRQIAEDRNGNLWIGTHTRGLYKYTKKEAAYNFSRNVEKCQAVDARTINALCFDKAGNLLVATSSNGVYVVDANTNQTLHHFTTDGPANQRLQHLDATAICIYSDTAIIIGAGGINVYNPQQQTIQPIRIPSSLPNDVAAIEKDRNGYLWITQSTGLFRLSPNKKNIFIVFDRVDGIMNDQFVVGASTGLPDGRLLFGSKNQFIVFDPHKIDLVDSLPNVAIAGFKVHNQSLLVDSLLSLKLIELAPHQNGITIELASLVFQPTSIIKYKLEGIDKNWKRADVLSQAVYPYLPPGTYTFLAQSENSEGVGNNITRLTIKIKPHYWQTWWFFGLIVFVCLGIFLWFDKLRLQRIKATESVRNRIAASLTEDMSNSLSSINITSELAKRKIDSDTERTREYIDQISDSSNRMVQAMYDMVWSINPENDTLQHTVDRMKAYAAEMETMYSPSIIFQVDEQAKELRLTMENRYEMLSIYKEAVYNAARHAQAKYIEVSLQYKSPSLILCVRDDGRGFNVELVELSRGLSEMRRRAGTINAKLTLKSEINTGTTVRLVIDQ
ncbi:sensor histidine kinase [Longitalea luteola]|uniref:sensor histidine kinase n=1 Tax=Longitalea luteola TaxID=2812563 RepID=UPI001A95E3DD|nr:sensor histidine kinase [Longitalea luteola]